MSFLSFIIAMHFNQQWIFKLCTTHCDKKVSQPNALWLCGYGIFTNSILGNYNLISSQTSSCPFVVHLVPKLFVPKYLDQMSRWCDMVFVLPNPAKRSVSRKLCAKMNICFEGMVWGIVFTRVSRLSHYFICSSRKQLVELKAINWIE